MHDDRPPAAYMVNPEAPTVGGSVYYKYTNMSGDFLYYIIKLHLYRRFLFCPLQVGYEGPRLQDDWELYWNRTYQNSHKKGDKEKEAYSQQGFLSEAGAGWVEDGGGVVKELRIDPNAGTVTQGGDPKKT